MAEGGSIMIQMIKKISLVCIAAGVLLILGGFAVVDFDVFKLSTTSIEDITMQTSEVTMDEINKLVVSVSEGDLKIKPVKGDKFILTYPESETLQYELNVTEHKIELKKVLKIKLMSWFEFPDQSSKVEIQVLESYVGSMDITCSHGDAEVNDLKNLSQFISDFKYGYFQMDNVDAKQMELNFAHGSASLNTMSADSLTINDEYMDSEYDNLKINKTIDLSSRHGSVKIMNSAAKILSADLRYSSMQLEDSTFTSNNKITYEHDNIKVENSSMNQLNVEGSYGDLELMDNKVEQIMADVRHGNIYGSLQGKNEDYAIGMTITHGESALVSQKPDAYKYELYITLDYGDAEISFIK